jgi:hypothetical protein
VRLQAARHSARLMWVSLSQKPMHAAMPSPPPPGRLGLASDPVSAAEPTPVAAPVPMPGPVPVPVREPPPPLDSSTGPGVGLWRGRGASWGAGAAMADGGNVREVVVGGLVGLVRVERDRAEGRDVPVVCALAWAGIKSAANIAAAVAEQI